MAGVALVALLLISSLAVEAGPSRVEERPYLASPLYNAPTLVQFDLLASDATIRVDVDDVVFEYTESSLVFTSDSYPFQRAVTFCSSLWTWVPWWADTAVVHVERVDGAVAVDGDSPVEDALEAFLEDPSSVVSGTPIEGTVVGDAAQDQLNDPPHLVPDVPVEGRSTCQYSGHGAAAGMVTARIS